jgi:hypothetical protein
MSAAFAEVGPRREFTIGSGPVYSRQRFTKQNSKLHFHPLIDAALQSNKRANCRQSPRLQLVRKASAKTSAVFSALKSKYLSGSVFTDNRFSVSSTLKTTANKLGSLCPVM